MNEGCDGTVAVLHLQAELAQSVLERTGVVAQPQQDFGMLADVAQALRRHGRACRAPQDGTARHRGAPQRRNGSRRAQCQSSMGAKGLGRRSTRHNALER
ncbi:hypothetical protein D3C86_1330570 [compost metagenome]